MIPVNSFAGKEVAVFGLARTGQASVKALTAGGAKAHAWDDDELKRGRAREEGALAAHPDNWPWDKLAALVLSPGVPLTHPAPHPVVVRAQAENVPVILCK